MRTYLIILRILFFVVGVFSIFGTIVFINFLRDNPFQWQDAFFQSVVTVFFIFFFYYFFEYVKKRDKKRMMMRSSVCLFLQWSK